MKLLGKWKLTKSSKGDLPPGLQAVIDFEKDGKVTMKVELADKKQDAAGTESSTARNSPSSTPMARRRGRRRRWWSRS